MKKNKLPIFIVFFLSFLFMEVIFRFFSVDRFFTISWLYIVFYISFLSFFLTFLCSFGNKKFNKIFLNVILFIITIWYCAEVIFKRSFHVYFSLSTTFFADQAISFLDKFFEILSVNFLPILLLFLPVLLSLIFSKKIDYSIKLKKEKLFIAFLSILSFFLFLGCLFINHNQTNSFYKLYFELNNNALNKESFGALPSLFMEIRKMIFPREVTFYQTIKEEEDEPIIYEKNILDIDFKKLYEKETDSSLKSMHQYFMNAEATYQNEYTGLFQNKNLILIMAESFNSIAVNQTITPTLYKLTHEGFVFENFYSPVILSTIGGEFQELTGLYPNLSMLSNVWRDGTNFFPFGFGTIFKNNGYDTFAYHNHKYNFQDRDLYLKSLGLTNYIGCGNGLEKRINCNSWPESDLEMMEETVKDFSNSSKFMTYYVTVSGHMSYNFTNNKMAIKNKETVKDLPYSNDIKAYLAANIELDKALESLIKQLEVSGKLNDTVIALVGDHYPYDISLSHINEIAEEKRDGSIEINRSNFILWNPNVDTVKIDKPGGNMDVLPTLLNLFGLPYDSRLIMGRDLLSDDDGFVIFADQSWVSSEGKYFASTNTFLPKYSEKDYNEYVEQMNQIVLNRINLSKLIIEKDYYKKVLGE